MAVVTTNLGPVTAYADAVAAGYTGTKAQWQALMADYATVGTQAAADAQTASTAAQTATTKASEASASATAAAASAASITTPDTTLTQSGKAADAKATGDKISEIKEDFTDIINSAYVTDSASGSVAHFVDGADGVPMKSLKVNIEPVQSGSGDPSPSNVRAISGKTSITLTRAGKNLVKPLAKTESGLTLTPQSDGGLLINGTYTGATGWFVISTNVRLKAGQTYTLSLSGMEITYGMNGYGSSNPVTPNADFVSNFRLRIENGQTFNNVLVYAQVEVGATATDFETSVFDSYTISLSSAGTVYGGTLDVLTGVLTVDRAIVDLGSLSWGYSAPRFYSGSVTDGITPSDTGDLNAVCEKYALYETGALANQPDLSFFVNSSKMSVGTKRIVIRDSNYTDAGNLKSSLNGVHLVYTLATPLTYQLSATEIKSLLGINNVWSDAGNVDVEYRADTKLYISRLTEPDADMIADANITSGKYFMIGNNLYLATANIASGASVIVGTNCIRKSLSEALNEINA